MHEPLTKRKRRSNNGEKQYTAPNYDEWPSSEMRSKDESNSFRKAIGLVVLSFPPRYYLGNLRLHGVIIDLGLESLSFSIGHSIAASGQIWITGRF
jgi:hypothetical protein